MLKYYEISNFKSFKNTTRFDLEKTNYKILSQSNTVGNVLKGIMFVGANASGKSNSILAIKFLLDCLFGKIDINMGRYICLFSNHPIMTLKYAFDIDGSEIIYTITFQRFDKKINEELILDGKRILYITEISGVAGARRACLALRARRRAARVNLQAAPSARFKANTGLQAQDAVEPL